MRRDILQETFRLLARHFDLFTLVALTVWLPGHLVINYLDFFTASKDTADAAARGCLHTLNIPGRQRHAERAQKARPKFPHASTTKTTVTGKPQVTVFAPGFC